MKKDRTWGVSLTLYEGARYSDVQKRTFEIHQIQPQTLADLLRSLAREVERDAGLRPPPDSAPAERSLEGPAATLAKEV